MKKLQKTVFLVVLLLASIFNTLEAKTIHVKDDTSLNIFFHATDDCFIPYSELTLKEAKTILKLKFTFSDKYKSYQNQATPNEDLKKYVDHYVELHRLLKQKKYDSMKSYELIIKIFNKNTNTFQMTTELLFEAERLNNWDFLAAYYKWENCYKATTPAAAKVAVKIINKLPQILKTQANHDLNLSLFLHYLSGDISIIDKISVEKLQEIRDIVRSKEKIKDLALVFDYFIAQQQGVSKDKFFNDYIAPNLVKINKSKYRSIQIILNMMVLNDNKFRDKICQKYPQILNLDPVVCRWIRIYQLTSNNNISQ